MSWNPFNKTVLTINSAFIDTNLYDFPLTVTVASGVGINEYNLTPVLDELAYVDRKKIAFFAGGDQYSGQQCYVEIEHWDSNKAILHVQIPTISSGTDTIINFYYDSTQDNNVVYVGDLDEGAAQSVWDSDFEAVYHMNQDPSGGAGAIKDSTTNINHGTPEGSMTGDDLVDGKVGQCLDFDGLSTTGGDRIALGNIQGGATAFTWELIVSSTQSIDDGNYYQLPVMIGTNQASGGSGDALFCVKLGNVAWFDEIGGGSTDTGQSISDGNWYHLAVTRNGTAIKIFKNGLKIDDITTGAGGINSLGIDICGANWTSNRHFGGLVDEVRFSNVARPDAWVKATYYSTFDTLITYSLGAAYYFDGYVTELESPVVRTVRAYRRDTGELMDETTSSGIGGYYYLETTYSGMHYLLCLDDITIGDTYNALIYDLMLPTISG